MEPVRYEPIRYPRDVREGAIKRYIETKQTYPSRWAAVLAISADVGCTPETLRRWIHMDKSLKAKATAQARNNTHILAEAEPKAEEGDRRSSDYKRSVERQLEILHAIRIALDTLVREATERRA